MTPAELPLARRLAPYALLALLSVPLLFYGLGSYSVVNGDEAHYHGVARTMVATGDWTRLEYTGEHRVYDTFMNAPLQYWARALLISAFGDNLWTMRILTALFALLSVCLTYRVGQVLVSPRAGLAAALVQLTTFQFVYMHSARTGELEPVLCLVFTAVALTFHRAVVGGRGFVPHHLLLALLLNLKLPLAIVPIAAELLFFAADRRSRPRFARYALLGVLLVPLGLVWHVVNYLALDDQARDVLSRMGDQASGEGASGGVARNALFYLRTAAFGLWPWTLALPLGVHGLVRLAREDGEDRGGARLAKLLVVYPAAVFLFFTFVSKFYPWYVLPAYPFLALWIGTWFDRELAAPGNTRVAAAAGWLAGGLLAVGVVRYTPFEERALKDLLSDLGPELWLRDVEGLPGALVLVGVGGLLFAAVRELLARGGTPAARKLVRILGGFLLLSAGARVLFPLRDVHHVSEMERIRSRIDAARARGEELTFPIEVPESGNLRVRFYFGDEFQIVKAPGPRKEGNTYLLIGEGRTPGNPPSFRTSDEHRRWERQTIRGEERP